MQTPRIGGFTQRKQVCILVEYRFETNYENESHTLMHCTFLCRLHSRQCTKRYLDLFWTGFMIHKMKLTSKRYEV